MLEVGLGLGREAAFAHRAVVLDQCRVNRHRQPCDLLLRGRLHFGEGLGLHRLLALGIAWHRQRCLAGSGEPRRQLSQVTPFAQELALPVDHLDVHAQVTFDQADRLVPGLVGHARTGHAQQFMAQGLGQRALAEGHAGQGSLDEVRHRHEVLAQGLGQVANQRHALGLEQAGHQPLQALARQARQQGRWHPHGHTVTGVIGLEVVGQRQAQFAHLQAVGVLRGGHLAGLARQHVFLAHDQQVGVFLATHAVPAVEGGRLVNLGRQTRFVEGIERFFIGQNIATAGLGLEGVEGFEQALVGRQALGPRLDLAAHQGFTNEQLAGGGRVDGAKVYRPAADQDQPIQGDLLIGHDLPALLLPMGLEVVLLDQVTGQRLDPVRLDARDHAGVKLGGFHQFGRHDPLRTLAPDTR